MLAVMRCVLAFSALFIISLYPTKPARLLELTDVSLAVYCLYSVVLAVISWRADWAPPGRAVHWADVLFYAYLVALTEGASSIFFYFFFFAILAASFSRGFKEGISVTLVSFVLFVTVGVAFALSGNAFEPNRTLIDAVYLLVFGYIISHLGGYESLLRGRLRLLREINNPWHPRFGANIAIGLTLQRLLDFYGGSSCTLVLKRTSTPPSYLMYRASPEHPDQAAVPAAIVESAAEPLLRLPETLAAFYHDPAGWWAGKFFGHAAYDLEMQMRTGMVRDECEALATLFDARAFVTVPYLQRDGTSGRLFLARERGRFSQSDVSFLAQVSGVMAAGIENMRLVEEYMSNAEGHERARISRDLHDTTLQPYLGLKLALDALQREAGGDNPVSVHVAELVAMTAATIRDLRDYTEKLKNNMLSMPGDLLAEAIRRQAERLERFYGIEIEVGIGISPQLSGRIAAEVLQMISEGLSNVLRHTTAKNAFVSVRDDSSHLVLQIGNEASRSPHGADKFMPRSIHDRAEALGGETVIEYRDDGYTVVSVTIPI